MEKPPVDAISSLEEGALRDAFCHFLEAVGVLSLWQELQGRGFNKRENIAAFLETAEVYG